ncbi:uncharacterized protein SCHCODRAFT_02578359 [Schizophyllum commune H4-8]|nr:uncharacterized protein SCHCODRAFT_02578359 [Schizophyllum commune H4-8]KAI5892276.1 hypothetical protein SCHCODRAFT_02578359 [Schizophyllum commune H4-8]
MADNGSMTARGLLNSDGNYAAQHQAMYDLLKYIQVGQSLPETLEAYEYRLRLNFLALIYVLWQQLSPLWEAYGKVKSDSTECKDRVYPSILNVADLTLTYARNAAGMDGESPYSHIFQCVRDLANATDQEEADRLSKEIDNFISVQTGKIDDLNSQSSVCTENLRSLEGRMVASQDVVKQRSDDLHEAIAQMVEDAENTEKQLKTLREKVAQTTAPYEQDQLVACAAPSYKWLELSGTIVMSAITSVRGSDATKIANLADDVWAIIANDGGEKKDRHSILADLLAIDADLTAVLTPVNTAIGVVEQMMGSWTAISDDLANLGKMVKDDIKSANEYIANLNEKKIISNWKDLAEAVEKYQGAAEARLKSTSDSSTSISMEELAQQLREQANS